jgi:hypothetical protein
MLAQPHKKKTEYLHASKTNEHSQTLLQIGSFDCFVRIEQEKKIYHVTYHALPT